MDTVGEEEGGMDWESGPETYTSPNVKQRASEMLIQGAQPSALEQPRVARCGEGREVQEEGNTHILMADSHCCMAETNTTL